MTSASPIPILDMFAGPGGLGEGFCSITDPAGRRAFKIATSIEMDRLAHQTLTLRSFVRQFPAKGLPPLYYQFLCGQIPVEVLYEKYDTEARKAQQEAWQATLGKTSHDDVRDRLSASVMEIRRRSKDSPLVLIGGPPCQAYSLVGRARMLSVRGQSFYRDHRHTLYQEYLRIIRDHVPDVFVMENVKGMLSSKLGGAPIFNQIREDLESPGDGLRYRLFSLWGDGESAKDFIVESERLGLPQARHRVIIIGVREPLANLAKGVFLKRDDALPESVTSWDVLNDLPKIRSRRSDDDTEQGWLSNFEDIFHASWLRELRDYEPDVARRVRDTSEQMDVSRGSGGEWVKKRDSRQPAGELAHWLCDPRMDGVVNHESRSHRGDDLHRYLFLACWAEVKGYSPTLKDFPRGLLPAHKNVQKALDEGLFNDRFRVLLKDRPSSTVTAHLSKDGHAFIHPDPYQCRSLTVREAARLQTFPDNYRFMGPRTEQFRQVGNAVPPLLARQVAEIVLRILRGG